MMKSAPKPWSRWVEPVLAVCVGAGLAWSLGYLLIYGHLNTPFFYEPFDTWMDWFNTAFWAHHLGAFETWGSIYPPLSFVVMKLVTTSRCYDFADPRLCDVYGIVTLHLFYILNIVLVAKTYLKIDGSTAIPRTFALTAGLPMVFALERGNLILLCFACLLLAYGPLLRSARWRWFFAACAINFKVYLVGTLFAQLLRRRWRWFEGAAIVTLLVYLVSFAIMGEGTPRQIYENIAYYSSGYLAKNPLDLMYAGTYKPLLSVLNGDGFPVITAIGSRQVEFWAFALPIVVYLVLGLIALAAMATAFRPTSIPMHRIVFLSIAAALISSEAGYYTTMFLLLFVFMEPWRGFGRIWSIVMSYLLCIPADVPLYWTPPIAMESFLGGRQVIAQFVVGVGPFARPGLILSIVVAMSFVTLRQVWDQLRSEGWRLGLPPRNAGMPTATEGIPSNV